jgi:DNA-binding FadR family transcriptional regulator
MAASRPQVKEIGGMGVALGPARLRAYVACCRLADDGRPITRRALAGALGVSKTWAARVLGDLRAAGWLTLQPHTAAGVRLLWRIEFYPEALARRAEGP